VRRSTLDSASLWFAFPLRIVNGAVATASRPDHVRQMIEQVIFTMPGERVMYPDFGVGLERLLFESTAREIITATESLVTGALHQWLGDLIAVRDVRIDVVETAVTVDVAYELIASRELRRERFAR
jgi:uncharacterized protein